MLELLQKEFIVEASIQRAWDHLTGVENWPSWAPHIRRAELKPEGALTAESTGRFHLANGIKSDFQMTDFHPPHAWVWTGPFLWLNVSYDHRFEAVGDERTRMTWIVSADGFAVSLLGRVFAATYKRNLETAVPRLQAELEAEEELG